MYLERSINSHTKTNVFGDQLKPEGEKRKFKDLKNKWSTTICQKSVNQELMDIGCDRDVWKLILREAMT